MTDPKTLPPEPNDDTSNDPEMQGEGNYTAARRHRESVEHFVESGQVEAAADAAAPSDSEEAEELHDAEEIGRSKARGDTSPWAEPVARERRLPPFAPSPAPPKRTKHSRMNPSSDPGRRPAGPRKARGALPVDSSTSNQCGADADAVGSTQSGASSGDTPIPSDGRTGACSTTVPPAAPASADPRATSSGRQ